MSSDETVVKFKVATITTAVLSIISLAVTLIGIWVSSVSNIVTVNSKDIATLKECTRNQQATLTRMESLLEDIRKDQIRRERKEIK